MVRCMKNQFCHARTYRDSECREKSVGTPTIKLAGWTQASRPFASRDSVTRHVELHAFAALKELLPFQNIREIR